MENFNGRKLVEGGELCERRNGISIWLIFVLHLSILEMCKH